MRAMTLRSIVVGAGATIAMLLTCDMLQAETVTCQRTIAKESTKFAKVRAKVLQKCEDKKVRGKLDPGTDCKNEPKIDAKLDKAKSKLHAVIDKKCGGVDQACGGDLTGESGGQIDLGWPATCPDLDDTPEPECMIAIGSADCTNIAKCLECAGKQLADPSLKVYYESLVPTDPGLQKDLNRCQRAIGKAGAKFLVAKAQALQKCWDRRLKGQHADDCPDGKAATKIAKAEAKRLAKTCKRCGGADQVCGGSGDFTAVQIGFESDCDDVTVPFGGPSCTQDPVTTLTELVTCVGCVTEFRVDCTDRVQVPQFGALPPECIPVP